MMNAVASTSYFGLSTVVMLIQYHEVKGITMIHKRLTDQRI